MLDRPRPGPARPAAFARTLVAAVLLAVSAAGAPGAAQSADQAGRASDPDGLPSRIVSLNPSLTAILVALGASERLAGIDTFSHRQQPTLAHLPSVGGLFDASLEAVVALEPDLVVLVPSVEQRDLRGRLERIGTRVAAFPNIRFADVLSNIEELGRLVGREPEAAARVAAIVRTRQAVERAARARPRVPCVVVLQRDPLFVVGRGSFLDEMLVAVGGENLAGALGDPYPRVGLEWLVASAPEVIVDMSLDAGAESSVLAYWQRWPTLPAVEHERVLHVEPELVTMPGPRLDAALRVLARALHGEAIEAEIEGPAAPRAAAADADAASSGTATPRRDPEAAR